MGTYIKRDGLIDHATLLGLLHYSPESGVFVWRVNRRAVAKAGDVAGSFDRQPSGTYWRIRIFRQRYSAHRLAFFYVHARWPDHEIDHINGDGMDNRITNLREATRYENEWNHRAARRDSKCGLAGVRCEKGRWSANISVHHKRINLGAFDTAQEAHAAYLDAKRRLHSTCTV